MAVHTCLARVENNIFKTLRHSMMVKQGANGNVFAYNYSVDPNRSEFPSNYGADICLHGHYPFANLFEGNINQNTAIDQAYGPSGPGNTFFRNRSELYGFIMTSGSVQSNQQIIVGNDIPSTTLFQGQYLLAGSGHYESANRVKNVVTPSGTNSLSDTSLYLQSKPLYWNASLTWPSIGIPVVQATNQLPTAIRYAVGTMLTPCEDNIDSSAVGISSLSTHAVHCFVNNNSLTIEIEKQVDANASIILYDILGKEIYRKKIYVENSHVVINDISKFKSGIYLGEITNPQGNFRFKFSLIN
jgi:hypothetical protein